MKHTEPVKLCCQCKHYKGGPIPTCQRPLKLSFSVVTGKWEQERLCKFPEIERIKGKKRCGPKGKHFEPASVTKRWWRR